MNCCPSATFLFLKNGVDIQEQNIQADGVIRQFLPYKNIVSVRYNYTRGDGATLTISAGKQTYIYVFPCNDSGLVVYKTFLENVPV
ncbi:MAG: hypothetical protein EBU66_12960 [Bacteroidetes bacterium]|nr:hypothetical protein [bacterium]NBP65556.1 hypothetical protein [Bacteroidota bacterium]